MANRERAITPTEYAERVRALVAAGAVWNGSRLENFHGGECVKPGPCPCAAPCDWALRIRAEIEEWKRDGRAVP